MSILFLLLTILSLPITTTYSAAAISGAATAAYDSLRSHGLPIGLFPSSIISFSVDPAGQFHLQLAAACTAQFETEVQYDSSINGTISYGQIASLSGMSAQELFLWFPVKEIRVDVPSSGLIYFDVGVIRKQFSLSLFESPPDCRAVLLLNQVERRTAVI